MRNEMCAGVPLSGKVLLFFPVMVFWAIVTKQGLSAVCIYKKKKKKKKKKFILTEGNGSILPDSGIPA